MIDIAKLRQLQRQLLINPQATLALLDELQAAVVERDELKRLAKAHVTAPDMFASAVTLEALRKAVEG